MLQQLPLSRRGRLGIFLLVFILLILIVSTRTEKVQTYIRSGWQAQQHIDSPPSPKKKPDGPGPDYARFIAAEQMLPQHNLEEGKNRRYVKFSNQVGGLGWNNVLTDIILCAHLAWRANRSYVFQDYSWQPSHYPWEVPGWPPPRSPLSTLIAGPMVGGQWEDGDFTPRSVREDFWKEICTPDETEILDTDVAKAPLYGADALTMLEHWVKLLQNSPKRCVDVVPSLSGGDGFPQVFDLWVVGSTRLLTMWPDFKKSPVSRLLATAPLVQDAIERNELLFLPKQNRPAFGYNPYDHMMAIHVRRGDYEGQCKHFANWNSTFFAWNLLPELIDPFIPPPTEYEGGHAPPHHMAAYMKRCLPSNDELLDKVEESRQAWQKAGSNRRLDILYVMTNANQEWVDELGVSMKQRNEKWDMVITSKELVLDFEQTGVNQAVDMELARKSAVYIGVGFSSMTSNIIHQRLVDDREPLANRFW